MSNTQSQLAVASSRTFRALLPSQLEQISNCPLQRRAQVGHLVSMHLIGPMYQWLCSCNADLTFELNTLAKQHPLFAIPRVGMIDVSIPKS